MVSTGFQPSGYRTGVPNPSVCVLLPCLDEVEHIDVCLASLDAQDYSGPMEILVADGGSQDGTLEKLEAWTERSSRVRVIPNPARVQSAGIWIAALASGAEILVRADAHTVYASDYVSQSVSSLTSSDAIAVGGHLNPVSSTGFGAAVAQAMTHPLGVGPAGFHAPEAAGPSDTVYLGAFRRSDFLDIGGMRTLPSRVAEDADLYFRWRQHGHTILLDPAIRSEYQPRDTPKDLWRQFFRYGRGKADMLYINGGFPSWRPFAPLGLVVGIGIGLVMLRWTWWPLAALVTAWLLVLLIAMRFRLPVVLAAAIMHLAYGLGLVGGLLRSPSDVRASVIENTQPE